MKLEWQPLTLTFRHSLETNTKVWSNRDVVLLRISCEEGWVGIGESAPLPGWGTETAEELIAGIHLLQQNIPSPGLPDSLESFEKFVNGFDDIFSKRPALRFGFETALLDAMGKRDKKPLYEFLTDQPELTISESFLLASTNDELFFQTAESASNFGYRTFKVKSLGEFRRDFERLQILRKHFDQISLRLDVNANWTVNETIARLDELAPVRLEYVEQPVNDLDMSHLLELCSQFSPPVALDESVATYTQAKKWITNNENLVFVLKPMTIGGIGRTSELIQLAQKRDHKVVLSSAMDSGIAAAAYRHLASAIGDKGVAHGIGTYRLLQKDNITFEPQFQNGKSFLDPTKPGLGIELDSRLELAWSQDSSNVSAR